MLGVRISGTKGDYIWDLRGTTIINEGSSSADPVVVPQAGNVEQRYVTGSGATGTYRNLYNKLTLSGGAGGEASRNYTVISAAAPVDTVNGAHNSLGFTGTGNITGLGCGSRNTLMVPNGNLGGTTTAVQAELYAEGASSANTGLMSLVRLSIGGDNTGITALTQHAGVVAFNFDAGCVDATNGVIDSNRTSNTASGCIKIYIGGIGLRWITYGTGS